VDGVNATGNSRNLVITVHFNSRDIAAVAFLELAQRESGNRRPADGEFGQAREILSRGHRLIIPESLR